MAEGTAGTAYDHAALQLLLRGIAAEYRTATDIGTPFRSGPIVLHQTQPARASTVGAADLSASSEIETVARAVSSDKVNGLQAIDPWLSHTLSVISEHRGGATAFDHARLDAAELLSTLLAEVSIERRPSVYVDDAGMPSFAAAFSEFYACVNVATPQTIAWYAERDGHEYFSENVEFAGHTLPQDLRAIFDS